MPLSVCGQGTLELVYLLIRLAETGSVAGPSRALSTLRPSARPLCRKDSTMFQKWL